MAATRVGVWAVPQGRLADLLGLTRLSVAQSTALVLDEYLVNLKRCTSGQMYGTCVG